MNTPETKPELNVGELAALYVAVRDRIKRTEKRHKEELAKDKEHLTRLAGAISQFLEANGLDNFATPYGTCYKSMKYSASLADPKVFKDYVIAGEHWEMLDWKANVTAVRSMLKSTNALPPGVNLSSISSIRVKRGAGAKDDDED